MDQFSKSLDTFANHGFAALPDSAQVLGKQGYLGVREGFGQDQNAGSIIPVSQLEEKEPYPGVDYIGMGYDIYAGNPEGSWQTMSDPGFKLAIRRISYEQGLKTRDNKYLTPDGSMTIPLQACARSEVARDKSTNSRLSDALHQDVKTTQGASTAKGSGGATFFVLHQTLPHPWPRFFHLS
jgi:hypothetical protein